MLRIPWVMVRSADTLLQVNGVARNTLKHMGWNTLGKTHTHVHTHIYTEQCTPPIFDK